MTMRRVVWLLAILAPVAACTPFDARASAPAAPPASASSSSATSSSSGAPSSSSAATTSTPPPTLQSAFDRVQSGVVRLEVVSCSEAVVGSGFELSPGLIATAAHVVQDGQLIRVVQGTTATAGRVVGLDSGTDVALIQTATPLGGYTFSFATSAPRVGDQIAAIGFPEGDPLSFNSGSVNGLGRKALIDGIARHDLLEMDADTNPGDSGGPVIRADGSVVGIVDAGPEDEPGRRFAVSSATASPLINQWTDQPEPTSPTACASVIDLNYASVPATSVSPLPADVTRNVLATLGVYFRAIDSGDFPTALAELAHPQSLATFTAGVTSSYDYDIHLQSLQQTDGEATAWLTLASQQDAGQGPTDRPQETCTDWSLDYVMVPTNGLWLIDTTRPHAGAGSAPCTPSTTSATASPSD